MLQCNLLLCCGSSSSLLFGLNFNAQGAQVNFFFLLMETEYWPGLNDGVVGVTK